MADLEAEKTSYGAFERFLFFATPIIFTIVLLGVLFALFDTSIMNGVLRAANKVPVLEKFIPEPSSKLKINSPSAPSDSSTAADNPANALEQVKTELAQAQAELQQASGLQAQKDQTIKDLKAQVAELEQKLKAKAQTDEEYKVQIQQLASIYANMTASKAAPIMESMTLKERILVLSEMKPADRGKILEKMSPKAAAETSIQMKDVVPSKDLQMAALQERLEANKTVSETKPAAMSKNDLGQTFSQMVPKSAAAILIEMNTVNQTRVLDILRSMDNAGRAKVISAINDASKQTAASLSAKLAE